MQLLLEDFVGLQALISNNWENRNEDWVKLKSVEGVRWKQDWIQPCAYPILSYPFIYPYLSIYLPTYLSIYLPDYTCTMTRMLNKCRLPWDSMLVTICCGSILRHYVQPSKVFRL